MPLDLRISASVNPLDGPEASCSAIDGRLLASTKPAEKGWSEGGRVGIEATGSDSGASVRACIPDADSLRMPSCVLCVPVLDFVPDLLRVFGALSAGCSLLGSGPWLDSAESLDMSSALVFSRDGSELDALSCTSVGGVTGFVGCGSLKRLCGSSVGDGKGDGRCAVPATVHMSSAPGLSPCFLASDSIAVPLASPTLVVWAAPSSSEASVSAACEPRRNGMPRPLPFPCLIDPCSMSHYNRNR